MGRRGRVGVTPPRFIDTSDLGLDFNRVPLNPALDADAIDQLLKAARTLQITRGCTMAEALNMMRPAAQQQQVEEAGSDDS